MKIITSTLIAMFLLAAAGYGQETGPSQVIGFGQPNNAPGKQFLYVVESTGSRILEGRYRGWDRF